MSASTSRPERAARYNVIAITLHWLVAALLVVNICAGLAGANADDKTTARTIIDLHKSIGLTLLGLVLLRVLWRLSHKPPPLPGRYPTYERFLAHGVHLMLYAVMLALPITGYIHDSAFKDAAAHPLTIFGLPFPRLGPIVALAPQAKKDIHHTFGLAHVYIGYALYGLFALHLIGVAKHHAIDREAELQRMLPETYRRPDPAG